MRLIDADALKKQWSMADKCEDCPQDARHCQFEQDFTRMDICEMIDEAPTIGGWISVKDRLPEEDGEYLVYIGDNRRGYYKLVEFTTDKTKENSFLEPGYGWSDYDDDYGYYEVRRVTHWMPMPEPPEEVTKSDNDV